MLEALKFVQGSVAKKDFVPELTHFKISDGMIKGFNGNITLCCPIDLDLEVNPKANSLIKAIKCCKDAVSLYKTGTGRLAVKSGKFKAFIDCIDTAYPDIPLDGVMVELEEPLLPTLKTLFPFISEDASHPWSRGILFKDKSAFVTNNIIFIEKWLGCQFPHEINIPHMAIKELIRIKEEPERLQIAKNSATFHFAGGKWLRTTLYVKKWPDVSPLFDVDANLIPFPEEFFSSVDELKSFISPTDSIYFTENTLSTSIEIEEGASMEVEGVPEIPDGAFHVKHLQMLEKVATAIDFSLFPKCYFSGDRLRGIIVGKRK